MVGVNIPMIERSVVPGAGYESGAWCATQYSKSATKPRFVATGGVGAVIDPNN